MVLFFLLVLRVRYSANSPIAVVFINGRDMLGLYATREKKMYDGELQLTYFMESNVWYSWYNNAR